MSHSVACVRRGEPQGHALSLCPGASALPSRAQDDEEKEEGKREENGERGWGREEKKEKER